MGDREVHVGNRQVSRRDFLRRRGRERKKVARAGPWVDSSPPKLSYMNDGGTHATRGNHIYHIHFDY